MQTLLFFVFVAAVVACNAMISIAANIRLAERIAALEDEMFQMKYDLATGHHPARRGITPPWEGTNDYPNS